VLELTESSKQKRDSKLRELLDEFSITHLRNSPAVALSGGERRRVEIARALAADPEFMLLDEPFAGIDPIAISDIRKLVRQLTARGIGVLVTDHNVRETLELIDKAFIIHEGQVLTEGTPDEIVSRTRMCGAIILAPTSAFDRS
jgi:lipopolysaccharide export system ATP-binding protein